jgi:hypothetical protein
VVSGDQLALFFGQKLEALNNTNTVVRIAVALELLSEFPFGGVVVGQDLMEREEEEANQAQHITIERMGQTTIPWIER